jgi:hypothetical protein
MRLPHAIGLILLALVAAAGVVAVVASNRPGPAEPPGPAAVAAEIDADRAAPAIAAEAPAAASGEAAAGEATGAPPELAEVPRRGKSPVPGRATATAGSSAIPQDLEAMERWRRGHREWNRDSVRGAYERVGRRDPRWDGPALEATELAARMFSLEVDPETSVFDVHPPARAAIDAGCDDPMIAYLHARTTFGPDGPGPAEMARRLVEVADRLADSEYPAFRRAIALQVAGSQVLAALGDGGPPADRARQCFDDALALLPESLRTDGRNTYWDESWYGTLMELIAGHRALGLEATEAFERVDAGMADLPGAEALRLTVRGAFWFNYGWEARTNALAPAVPAGGFEKLAERTAIAREAFERAWQLQPDNPRVASYMMDIDKASDGDRQVMERWFERAMRANGDWYTACLTKLDWLDPKWHGSVEEMIAFGRDCLETGNWRAGITLLCPEAHFRYICMIDRAEGGRYLGSPEVWPEIASAYDEFLEHHPSHTVMRSKYAAMASIAGRYDEAHAQFEILGDGLTTWTDLPSIPLVMLGMMRDEARRLATGEPE